LKPATRIQNTVANLILSEYYWLAIIQKLKCTFQNNSEILKTRYKYLQ